MNRFNEPIAVLASKGKFKSRHLAERAGVSRQAAVRELRLRVASGELRIQGVGRGTWYLPAGIRTFASSDEAFWADLLSWSREVDYVRVVSAVGRRPSRRSEADRILSGLGEGNWVFLDFENVELASPAFLRRLFIDFDRPVYSRLQPINLGEAVRVELRHLQRMDELTPQSDYGT